MGTEVFHQKRTAGVVTGLILDDVGDNGQPVVLIDATLVLSDQAAEEVNAVHLFTHEGWHVVLTERGEHPKALLARLAPQETEGFFMRLAVEALGEYRVELPASKQGAPTDVSRVKSIHHALTVITGDLEEADAVDEDDRGADWDITLRNNLVDLFSYLAQLAAQEESVPSGDIAELVRRHRCWARLVGPYWEPFRTSLKPAPPASVPMTIADQDAVIHETADLLREWLTEKLGIRSKHLRTQSGDEFITFEMTFGGVDSNTLGG